MRKPDDGEWKATLVLKFPINDASAKVRTGGPIDDEADYSLPIWAGVVPVALERKLPVPDALRLKDIELPDYLT